MELNVYADNQGLPYCDTKQKVNSRQQSWYLHMCDVCYNIHYRPGTKIRKPDGLARHLGEEKSQMYGKFLEAAQFLYLGEDENGNIGHVSMLR